MVMYHLATPRIVRKLPNSSDITLYLSGNDKETYTYADVFGETTFGDNGGIHKRWFRRPVCRV